MFTVNSLSSSPTSYTNSLNNHAQPSISSNQIVAKIQSIQNISIEPVTIGDLPHLIIDEIGQYLESKDIQNLNKANVGWKIDPERNQIRKYRTQIKKLQQWENECPKGTKENRKKAVERIINCIKKEAPILDLGSLKLTSLPDLSSFKFITRIIYDGNNVKPISNCFSEDYLHGGLITLPKHSLLSLLPDGIETIITSYDNKRPIACNSPNCTDSSVVRVYPNYGTGKNYTIFQRLNKYFMEEKFPGILKENSFITFGYQIPSHIPTNRDECLKFMFLEAEKSNFQENFLPFNFNLQQNN